MGRLVYSMIVSQDGFVADADGDFSWGRPAEDALAAVNDEMRDVGTYLYGRRMYELMAVWETDPAVAAQSPESQQFATLWQQTEKVVFSTTLDAVHTSRTRLATSFDPYEVRRMKAAADHDLTIDGPTLASAAFEHGLVDSVSLLICPLTLGGGLRFWPSARLQLELRSVERFERGVVRLSYGVEIR